MFNNNLDFHIACSFAGANFSIVYNVSMVFPSLFKFRGEYDSNASVCNPGGKELLPTLLTGTGVGGPCCELLLF